jgi:hypothetical protein
MWRAAKAVAPSSCPLVEKEVAPLCLFLLIARIMVMLSEIAPAI